MVEYIVIKYEICYTSMCMYLYVKKALVGGFISTLNAYITYKYNRIL